MTTRRDVLQTTAGALASLVFVGCGLTAFSTAQAQTRRREVVVNGKRVKTVDIHSESAIRGSQTSGRGSLFMSISALHYAGHSDQHTDHGNGGEQQ